MLFNFLFLKDASFRNILACIISCIKGYTELWSVEEKLFKVE